jgi:hypothetical protein
MKKQTKIFGLIFSVILLSAFLIMSLPSKEVQNANSDALIKYGSSVCTYVTRADGSIEDNGCHHNLLTNAGKNAIRSALTNAGTPAFKYIGLCNASYGGNCNGTNAGDTSLYNEFPAGVTGLNRTNEATYLALGTGNWSYSRTFVAGADDMVTNKTGIFNATSGDTMLAVNTFTTSTLQTNDQITINWSIWVA